LLQLENGQHCLDAFYIKDGLYTRCATNARFTANCVKDNINCAVPTKARQNVWSLTTPRHKCPAKECLATREPVSISGVALRYC